MTTLQEPPADGPGVRAGAVVSTPGAVVPEEHVNPQSSLDPITFRRVLGHHPTGASVVTAMGDDGRPAGMVVGTFTSVSLDPPLVAFLPDKSSTSWPRIREAGSFCVNVLSASQQQISRQFAQSGGEKFRGIGWRPASSGAPIIEGTVAWVDCDIEQVFESGDHYIVIGRVRDLAAVSAEVPLAFWQGRYGRVHLEPEEPVHLRAMAACE